MTQSKLTEHKAADVRYTKSVGGSGQLKRTEVTDRTIIPTIIPSPNIKALDVTGLTEDEVLHLEDRLAEYAKYYKRAASNIFSFDDWLDMVYHESGVAKWRTFKQADLEVLDDD